MALLSLFATDRPVFPFYSNVLQPRVDQDGMLSIYIGDDQTDEDAFRAFRRKAIPVLVGLPSLSSVRYYVKDPSEVFQFLNIIQKEVQS